MGPYLAEGNGNRSRDYNPNGYLGIILITTERVAMHHIDGD
jgi:hypothetical protein